MRLADKLDDVRRAHVQGRLHSKYVERIAAIFGTPAAFARSFSQAILITPTHLHT